MARFSAAKSKRASPRSPSIPYLSSGTERSYGAGGETSYQEVKR
jgi:hypothetical protein